MAQTVVQKFGGSSVADAVKLRKVAQRVKARKEQGWNVVVVVSAMGDTTDELLALAKGVSANPPRRELDMLLTCGERISMALLSMALHELGVPAISFTGSQSGIITDEAHAQARIVEVRPARIEAELERNKVVIVAGYQGVSRHREVTTLGRGGSDTTAVALAAALGADCEIYSDVDGIFSADPLVVANAKKLDALSFDEMQELAAAGAKVLNAQAVEFAREKGIHLVAKSTHGDGHGTSISQQTGVARVKGVTCDTSVWIVKTSGPLSPLLNLLDELEIRGRTVVQGSLNSSMVVIPLEDVHGAEALKKRLPSGCEVLENCATVTCVGVGLNADWGVTCAALDALASFNLSPEGIFGSSLQLTVVVPREFAHQLTRALHQSLCVTHSR